MATVVAKNMLQFGMLTIPVKIYSAARSESISFKQIIKGDDGAVHQVGQKLYDKTTLAEVTDRSKLLKGFELDKATIIEITPAEIEALAPKSSKTLQIIEFVPLADVDPIYFDSSYYVTPDDGGKMPYNILYAAMKNKAVYGIAKWCFHNREQLVALRLYKGGITLHTLFYEDEVRGISEYKDLLDDAVMKNEALIGMCAAMIDTELHDFDADKYQDEFRLRVQAMIEEKKVNPTATYTGASAPVKEDPAEAMMRQMQAFLAQKQAETGKAIVLEAIVAETEKQPEKVMVAGAGSAGKPRKGKK